MAARRPMQTRPASTADAVHTWTRRGSSCGARDHSARQSCGGRGNAVHAGIDAADAITAARAALCGRRTLQSPAHLEKVGGEEGRKVHTSPPAPPLKNRAKYDPDPIAAPEAKRRSRRRYAWCESPSKQCDSRALNKFLLTTGPDPSYFLLRQSPTAQIQARSGALAGNLGAWRSHALPCRGSDRLDPALIKLGLAVVLGGS